MNDHIARFPNPAGPSSQQALARLRETPDIGHLAELTSPTQFLDDLFLLLGRNLAVANGFLTTSQRQEGVIAFLCCRVLDAHEDLEPDGERSANGILDAAHYLCGTTDSPPAPPQYDGTRATNQLEALLSARLPWLRQALQQLPPASQTRIQDLLQDLARAMAHDRRQQQTGGVGNLSQYGRDVLGRVVEYSLQLLQIQLPDTVDFRPIGQALQSLNHIRDFSEDRAQRNPALDEPVLMLRLLLELAETSCTASVSLRRLAFAPVSGERAALTYMVATSLASIYKQLRVQPPLPVSHALLSARLCRYSQRLFDYLVTAIDDALLQLLNDTLQRESGQLPATKATRQQLLSTPQELFELEIADTHPDRQQAIRLKHYIRLSRLSLAMLDDLPLTTISRLPRHNVEGRKIMISDYFMAAAVSVVCEIGSQELALLSRVGAELIEDREKGLGIDAFGRTAAALTRVIMTARGINATDAAADILRNQQRSQQLFARRDRTHWLLNTLTGLLQARHRRRSPLATPTPGLLFTAPSAMSEP